MRWDLPVWWNVIRGTLARTLVNVKRMEMKWLTSYTKWILIYVDANIIFGTWMNNAFNRGERDFIALVELASVLHSAAQCISFHIFTSKIALWTIKTRKNSNETVSVEECCSHVEHESKYKYHWPVHACIAKRVAR